MLQLCRAEAILSEESDLEEDAWQDGLIEEKGQICWGMEKTDNFWIGTCGTGQLIYVKRYSGPHAQSKAWVHSLILAIFAVFAWLWLMAGADLLWEKGTADWLVAGGWCWFSMREQYCWLVGWQAKRTQRLIQWQVFQNGVPPERRTRHYEMENDLFGKTIC